MGTVNRDVIEAVLEYADSGNQFNQTFELHEWDEINNNQEKYNIVVISFETVNIDQVTIDPPTGDYVLISNIADSGDITAKTAGKILDATAIIDEDDFISNSDTKVPTQQSTHLYVDRRDAFLSNLGTFRKGMQLSFPSGTSLAVSLSTGTFLKWDEVLHANLPFVVAAEAAMTFRYMLSDGTEPVLDVLVADPSSTTVVTNTEREDAGVVVDITNAREVVHRLFISMTTGDKVLLLAQHEWNTASEVLQKFPSELVVIPAALDSYEYVAAILVSNGSDDYRDGNNSGIIMASDFGAKPL